MASLIDIAPCVPRIAAPQQHRENPESDTPFIYYRKKMCLPFINHLINRIDVRFDKHGETVLMMQALIPSIIVERDVTIDDVVEIYKEYLPALNNCQEEFIRWKRRWSVRDISESPQTIAQALKQCNREAHPNL